MSFAVLHFLIQLHIATFAYRVILLKDSIMIIKSPLHNFSKRWNLYNEYVKSCQLTRLYFAYVQKYSLMLSVHGQVY